MPGSSFLAVALFAASSALAAAPPAATGEPRPSNPLLEEWKTPFGLPPFAAIQRSHLLPALEEAMAAENKEIAAIATRPEAPSFANTVEALEASGSLLRRVNAVFQLLVSADTNEALQAVNRQVAPRLSAQRDDINLNDPLFQRVRAVWESRSSLKLAPDQQMLLERTWKRFVRAGAALDSAKKQRLRAVNTELANAPVKFAENLLAETNAYRLVLDQKEDLAGLPDRVIASAAEAAKKAGLDGKWLFTLHAPSLWPFMEFSRRRELRKKLYDAYAARCNQGGPHDNKALIAKMAALRAEKAQLLGFSTWADYTLDDTMAATPTAVYGLLDQLWGASKSAAARETEDLEAAIKADGERHALEPYDWFYYREKVRKAKYDLQEGDLRPYFPLDRVREGAFHAATQLYGITFRELKDVPVYHPEVKAFEVKDRDGSHLAVFLVDYFPRPGKRSGGWTSSLRGQFTRGGQDVRPLVYNVCNFSRPVDEAPALLSLEETRTLFHEFGHALHAMLSRKRYESLGRTPRDFVELPSQVMENWAIEPAVLKGYARHWKTGEPIPAALVEKIDRARRFDQGFRNVENVAASLLDMEWHTLSSASPPDASALERIALARMALPSTILPRYRSTYFQHIFGQTDGYSSGYYSYKWAEVLEADAFALFKEKGIFDRATANALRKLLEKGGSEDVMQAYVKFRGRKPAVEPLLKKLGLGS